MEKREGAKRLGEPDAALSRKTHTRARAHTHTHTHKRLKQRLKGREKQRAKQRERENGQNSALVSDMALNRNNLSRLSP